jgi:hypothetical protein
MGMEPVFSNFQFNPPSSAHAAAKADWPGSWGIPPPIMVPWFIPVIIIPCVGGWLCSYAHTAPVDIDKARMVTQRDFMGDS